jgi:hypothetical protein
MKKAVAVLMLFIYMNFKIFVTSFPIEFVKEGALLLLFFKWHIYRYLSGRNIIYLLLGAQSHIPVNDECDVRTPDKISVDVRSRTHHIIS